MWDIQKAIDGHATRNLGKALEGPILDLRNNPGGLVDQAVVRLRRVSSSRAWSSSTRGRVD